MSNIQTAKTEVVTFKVFRFNIQTDVLPHYETHELKVNHEESVLDILNRLKWEKISSLSYQSGCQNGICGSCSIKVNGRAVLACKENLFDLIKLVGNEIILSPLSQKRAIKDFIIDKKDFWQKYDAIKPYFINETNKDLIVKDVKSSQSIKHQAQANSCTECAICYYSCPIVQENDEFFGPAAFVKAYHLTLHVQDDEYLNRLEEVNMPVKGVWECSKCFECVTLCPENINPLEKIIKLRNSYFTEDIKVVNKMVKRQANSFLSSISKFGLLNRASLFFLFKDKSIIRKIYKTGKFPLPWNMPKSKNLDEIQTLIKISKTSKS